MASDVIRLLDSVVLSPLYVASRSLVSNIEDGTDDSHQDLFLEPLPSGASCQQGRTHKVSFLSKPPPLIGYGSSAAPEILVCSEYYLRLETNNVGPRGLSE